MDCEDEPRNSPTLEGSMRRIAVAVVAAFIIVAMSGVVTRVSARATADNPTPGALDDPTIVAIFDAANTADIETGTLAAERGASKEVRDFGAMLARDHKQVRQQGRDLAKKLAV